MNHIIFSDNIRSDHDMNIVIDLDETLIHCINPASNYCHNKLKKMDNFLFSFMLDNSEHIIFGRPYLKEFIGKLMDKFNIYISTHAHEIYAKYIISHLVHIIPSLKICGVHYRVVDQIFGNMNVMKTLDVFNLTTENTIIVDDKIEAWDVKFHSNIINIKKYYGPHNMMNINDNHLYIINNEIERIYDCYVNSHIPISNYLYYFLAKYHIIPDSNLDYKAGLPIYIIDDYDDYDY